MALKLYRRHRKDCEAELPEDARTGQFVEVLAACRGSKADGPTGCLPT
jgi:hypothetical protein